MTVQVPVFKVILQNGFMLRALRSINLESYSLIGLYLPKLLRIKVNFHVVLVQFQVLVQVPVLKIIFAKWIFVKGS